MVQIVSRDAMEQDKLVIVFKNISQKEIYARWSECQKYSHRITKQPFLFWRLNSVLSVIIKSVINLDKYRKSFAENRYDKVSDY